MSDIVIVQTVETDVAEITQEPAIVVVVDQPAPQIVEVVAMGPQGPQGVPGTGGSDTSLGGFPLSVAGASDGDVLGFNGTAWYNRPQETLADGGNF